MHGSQHTVSIAFVRSAVRAIMPTERERVLAVAGIAPALLLKPAARVPAAAFGALWMAVARELDDEFFGLDSRRMKVGSFALLCRSVAAQSTLDRALRDVLRGFAVFFDDIGATLTIAGREARIVIDNRIRAAQDEAELRRFADETLLVMVHGLLCWLAGRRVPLSRLDWAHPQPTHGGEYRRMFSPELHFDQAATAIAFDARLLQAKVSISPASLASFLRDAPQSVFLKQLAGAGWAERARRELRRDFIGGGAGLTQQAMALALAISPATLRRRLLGEGAHWQQLKDELRRELAIAWLADRRISVEQVALRLGYNDAPTFHRAFRKWTGATPSRYRGR